MKRHFSILVLTGILLILGWTIVEYLLQSQIQYQFQQVSSYPILVYSWDVKLLQNLQEEVEQKDFVRETVYKTSEQSAVEMIQKYGLSGAEEILQERALPDMLLIYLKGDAQSRSYKIILRDKLDNHSDKDRIMTEYQNDIWDNTFKRVDQLSQIRWILIAFIGLVIFLVFLLKRLHYEHHLARIRHLLKAKPVEDIKVRDHFWGNSFLLWILPVGISVILYQLLYYNDWLIYTIDWYFFLIELGVIILATLIAYPFVLKYKHEESQPKEELQ